MSYGDSVNIEEIYLCRLLVDQAIVSHKLGPVLDWYMAGSHIGKKSELLGNRTKQLRIEKGEIDLLSVESSISLYLFYDVCILYRCRSNRYTKIRKYIEFIELICS